MFNGHLQIAKILKTSTDWLLENEEVPEPDKVHLLENHRVCDDARKETMKTLIESQENT